MREPAGVGTSLPGLRCDRRSCSGRLLLSLGLLSLSLVPAGALALEPQAIPQITASALPAREQ